MLRRLLQRLQMPEAEDIALIGAIVLAGIAVLADFVSWLSQP